MQIGPEYLICDEFVKLWCAPKKTENNCQQVRVESSQSRAWTALLEAPL